MECTFNLLKNLSKLQIIKPHYFLIVFLYTLGVCNNISSVGHLFSLFLAGFVQIILRFGI